MVYSRIAKPIALQYPLLNNHAAIRGMIVSFYSDLIDDSKPIANLCTILYSQDQLTSFMKHTARENSET